MPIDPDVLRAALRGCIAVEETAEGPVPRRLTGRQRAYCDERWSRGDRATNPRSTQAPCTAGVVLDLVTDSPWLELELAIGIRNRNPPTVDLEVDGAPPRSLVGPEEDDRWPLRFELGTDGSRRRVRIHLPYVVEVALRSAAVAGGSAVEPAPRRPRRLLACGDSITQGVKASSAAAGYATRLAGRLDAELLNQGLAGHRFDHRVVDPGLPWSPDLVTVAYGTNDWNSGAPLEEIDAEVRRYVGALRAAHPDAPIVVLSPLWRSRPAGSPQQAVGLAAFGAAIREAAVAIDGVQAIDGFELVPHDDAYLADGIHPNDEGMERYAAAVFERVAGVVGAAG